MMAFTKEDRQTLAKLLLLSLQIPNLKPVRSIKDRTWIFIKFDRPTQTFKALPAGLAIMATQLINDEDPHYTFWRYAAMVKHCGWSYETAAAQTTGVSASLLVEANKAHDKHSIETMIHLLMTDQPLIVHGTGPRIIDPISDPGK